MRFDRTPLRVGTLVFIIYLLGDSKALFKFTNVKCNSYDESFCEFKTCGLKVLGRGIVGLTINAKIHQLPIRKMMWIVTLYRRFNGFRPFLFNITVDVCHFHKHQTPFSVFNVIYEGLRNFTNLNHSCPYNHDVIIDRMIPDENMLRQLPVPNGIYKLVFLAKTDGVWRCEIEVHVEVNLGFDRR